ncbi:MAG: rhodanese-like domain-containing protein [Alphaproteobacteria bacterium]|nr:rhodanese-like domain-containing protein [Alphaproteobacteria bacterium]
MIRAVLNLPFKVIGKAARVVQDRDRAQRARQVDAPGASMAAPMEARSPLAVPDDFDPGKLVVSAADCARATAEGTEMSWVDVRADAAFAREHVPGAMSAPGESMVDLIAELPASVRVIVYGDRAGRDARAVATFLRFRGLEDVWVLDGGFPAWKAATSAA